VSAAYKPILVLCDVCVVVMIIVYRALNYSPYQLVLCENLQNLVPVRSGTVQSIVTGHSARRSSPCGGRVSSSAQCVYTVAGSHLRAL